MGPYTVAQTAKILGVHPDTVRDWCERGALAAQRTLGGHRRITAAAIDAFIAARMARAA